MLIFWPSCSHVWPCSHLGKRLETLLVWGSIGCQDWSIPPAIFHTVYQCHIPCRTTTSNWKHCELLLVCGLPGPCCWCHLRPGGMPQLHGESENPMNSGVSYSCDTESMADNVIYVLVTAILACGLRLSYIGKDSDYWEIALPPIRTYAVTGGHWAWTALCSALSLVGVVTNIVSPSGDEDLWRPMYYVMIVHHYQGVSDGGQFPRNMGMYGRCKHTCFLEHTVCTATTL